MRKAIGSIIYIAHQGSTVITLPMSWLLSLYYYHCTCLNLSTSTMEILAIYWVVMNNIWLITSKAEP